MAEAIMNSGCMKQPWSLLSPLLPLFPFLLIFSILNKLHLVFYPTPSLPSFLSWKAAAAAAAAAALQLCPTLCNPIDGSPPGSPVPGILQAKTLEWVAISFSNAWKWKVKVKSLNRARLLATPWTAAYQAPPSMGFSRQEYWTGSWRADCQQIQSLWLDTPAPFVSPQQTRWLKRRNDENYDRDEFHCSIAIYKAACFWHPRVLT